MKKKLRQIMLEKRNALSEAERTEKSERIIATLFSLPEFRAAHAILFYASIKSEVQTHRAIARALALGKRVCLPRVNREKRELELYEVRSMGELKPGVFGILEPVPEKSVRVQPGALELVVVPGVAFTEKGCRLGYGMRYYDGLLKQVKCPAIALAFELQIIPAIPTESHDVDVHKIVTEERLIECRK
ncbi:MAG: 5-formyltetrahydrofolate cyclo-ligase [Candidatus Micrarchaeia archaeon]